MKYFKLKYADGNCQIVKGKNALEIIRRYDLTTKEHVETRIFELSGEQLAIAQSNDSKGE